uniref:Solute carrier family 3 member 2 n=1 Tax=Rousettus aegyptiacus TaxID=9407 RepID=A0A7J8H7D5_ROUAE|nr:solute carrier family 3 member 2 [Rousettus aegyptiacus]
MSQDTEGDMKEVELKLLIAGTGFSNLEQILSLLRFTKDLLLTSSYLSDRIFTGEHIKFLASQYLNVTNNHWCSWSLSQAGLLTSFVPRHLLRLYQLLFFTLPGTPVFSPGSVLSNMTVKGQSEDPGSLLSLFRQLSNQRGKERSLLHGDFHALTSGSDLFAYVRRWDQNKRFLVVLNFGDVGQTAPLAAASAGLPAKVDLLLSTQPGREADTSLELEHLKLEPHEGLLLHFPYVA